MYPNQVGQRCHPDSSLNLSLQSSEPFSRQLTPDEYSSLPEPTGEILSIWDFERISRRTRKTLHRVSCLPIQVIIECSKYGRSWVPLSFLVKSIGSSYSTPSASLLKPAFDTGLLESARGSYCNNTKTRYVRIGPKAELVSVTSHDGQLMSSIKKALDIYICKYPETTTLLALILSAFMVRKIVLAPDISFFVYGNKNRSNLVSTTRLIGRLHELGLIHKERLLTGSQGRAIVLSEVFS
jgi:hypothetical protein